LAKLGEATTRIRFEISLARIGIPERV